MDIINKIVANFDGKYVVSYNLRNSKGFGINVLNYGGIITDILVPDKKGKIENVLMKYKDINVYKENPSYYGALIGRTSGRICEAKLELRGEDLKLSKNYGIHQTNGGENGFSKQIFDVETSCDEKEASIELSYLSKDGEEGYPGNFKVKVKYTITEDNEFKISYKGVSDKATLVNLTNCNCFNLSGDEDTILNHYLYIDSDFFIELDKTYVPTGIILRAGGTPFDFTSPKTIGRDIDEDDEQISIAEGYNHPWVLNGGNQVKLKLYHKKSGRVMDVYTNQKTIVVYTLNQIDEETLENGRKPVKRGGVVIEPQSPPIGREDSFISHSIIEKDEKYEKETIYKFSIR